MRRLAFAPFGTMTDTYGNGYESSRRQVLMSNRHFSIHTAEDRTDQKLYRHQFQPNCTKESLATDHGGNPATYNPSEVAAFHRSLLLSD